MALVEARTGTLRTRTSTFLGCRKGYSEFKSISLLGLDFAHAFCLKHLYSGFINNTLFLTPLSGLHSFLPLSLCTCYFFSLSEEDAEEWAEGQREVSAVWGKFPLTLKVPG